MSKSKKAKTPIRPVHPIEFTVAGIPRLGGSKRGFVIAGRAVLVDDSGKKGNDWRGDCRTAAHAVMPAGGPFNAPMAVDVRFIMPRPAKHYRSNGTLRPDAPLYCSTIPDTTKLMRSLEDALTALVWLDDKLIVSQRATKEYGDEPGAIVKVTPAN